MKKLYTLVFAAVLTATSLLLPSRSVFASYGTTDLFASCLTVDQSSSLTGGHTAAFAFDNDDGTQWHSLNTGFPNWIACNPSSGFDVPIGKLELLVGSGNDHSRLKNWGFYKCANLSGPPPSGCTEVASGTEADSIGWHTLEFTAQTYSNNWVFVFFDSWNTSDDYSSIPTFQAYEYIPDSTPTPTPSPTPTATPTPTPTVSPTPTPTPGGSVNGAHTSTGQCLAWFDHLSEGSPDYGGVGNGVWYVQNAFTQPITKLEIFGDFCDGGCGIGASDTDPDITDSGSDLGDGYAWYEYDNFTNGKNAVFWTDVYIDQVRCQFEDGHWSDSSTPYGKTMVSPEWDGIQASTNPLFSVPTRCDDLVFTVPVIDWEFTFPNWYCNFQRWFYSLFVFSQNLSQDQLDTYQENMETKAPFAYVNALFDLDLSTPSVSTSTPSFTLPIAHTEGVLDESYSMSVQGDAVSDMLGYVRPIFAVFIWGSFIVYLFLIPRRLFT